MINRNKTNYGAILTIYFVHVTEQRYHFHLIVGCGFIVIKQLRIINTIIIQYINSIHWNANHPKDRWVIISIQKYRHYK